MRILEEMNATQLKKDVRALNVALSGGTFGLKDLVKFELSCRELEKRGYNINFNLTATFTKKK
jgi:hypothetical protein